MLAMAFLAATTAAERDRSPSPPTLIPLTLNEFRRLFDSLILTVTTSVEHTITWSTCAENIKQPPGTATIVAGHSTHEPELQL